MLTPFQDPTLASECRDVEFLLYGGNNRLYTVHGDHLIKLWTLPLYDPTQECRLYRVFVAEGTVRNIHVVKRHPVNRLSTPGSLAMEDGFLSCEFTERGNHVSVWNVENGASEKIKGLSSSYMGSDVRVCSVLYLSSHILAVLISDQGIVHAIDIWNTRTGVCVHGQIYKAYLPVQNMYNIHGYLLIQPWSSMAEIIVWQVGPGSYHKVDTGTLLTAPPNNIATYRCVISEETGHIIAGGTTLKIFHLNLRGKIQYICSIDIDISGKLLEVIVLHSKVFKLLLVDNAGISVYNKEQDTYGRIPCQFKHRNKDILIRADSGFTYRPYLFFPDNGILLVQDTYANEFYQYQLPLDMYVPNSYAEIRKNARLLHQYYKTSCLPAEMWVTILSYTGYLYDKTFARKLANTFFCRPLS